MENAASLLLPVAGLFLGLAFGAAVRRSDWCAMGAVADIRLMGDWRRMRSWLLAIAVAILGTQGLVFAGALDLAATSYLAPGIRVLPAIAGGLAFGFGMTMTGGCVSKNLVRLGGGSLRSLVVLMTVGIAALATMVGPLVWLQLLLAEAGTLEPGSRFPRQDLPALLGVDGWPAMLLAVLIAVGLAWFCLRDPRFRASRPLVVAGLTLGLLVPLGWLATTWLGDPFEPAPVASLNYVGASASTLIVATTGTSGALPFPVALLGGTVLGALAVAAAGNGLALEGFAGATDLRRQLGGAVLMGAGGVIAGGCTIGQGLSGLSTLGLTSILAFAAIVAGALVGIRTLEHGGVGPALRALVAGQRA